MKIFTFRRFAVLLALVAALIPLTASAKDASFIGQFNKINTVASTVPSNGDLNPYGVAVVRRTVGDLTRGDILVSNFNNSANLQGTGTTIVEIAPDGNMHVFAQLNAMNLPGTCPGGIGLTTALVALDRGWVVVGSLPTTDGSAATAQAGCLIVLDSHGNPVQVLADNDFLNGPWDMTARDEGDKAQLYVSTVLNGTVAANGNVVHQGRVVRVDLTLPAQGMPRVKSLTMIGSGFAERTDPDALVIGPTGLALGNDDTLYVADTLDNRIAAISKARTRGNSEGRGRTVSMKGALNNPLGLALAPNGDLVAANAGDGNLVEVTPRGAQVAVKLVESAGGGSLFGLAIEPNGTGVYFVDDATNALNLLH